MPRTIRVIAAGLLLLVLGASTLMALPSARSRRAALRVESGNLLTTVRDWLVSVFIGTPEPSDSDSEARPKEGSQLDPNGVPSDGH